VHRRVRTILRAYAIASVCSGFAIAFLMLLSTWVAMVWRGEWEEAAAQAIVGPFWLGWVGFFVSIAVGAFALVPALPAIIVAEAARVRSRWFYGLAGAAAGPSAYCLYAYWNDVGPFASPNRFPQWTTEAALSYVGFELILVSAGLIGGLTYRRFAGRGAGEWCGPSTVD